MGLSNCETITDLHDQELANHGDITFPIACYADDLTHSEVPWHWHEEWEFVLVTEGRLRFYMENAVFTLSCGDGIFINTKALHAIKNTSLTAGKLHSVVFHPRLIGGNVDSIYWKDLVKPLITNNATRFLVLQQNTPWQSDVLQYFHTAWRSITDEPDDYKNDARYFLSKALHLIIMNTDFLESNLSAQELIKANRIRTMMEYISLHYMEQLSVDQLASIVSISSSACLRCFHEMLQTTPMQYVIDTRLRNAAAMLKNTHKSAKDIAIDCGFSDTSYFTKMFRLKYHCTPGSYRSEALND